MTFRNITDIRVRIIASPGAVFLLVRRESRIAFRGLSAMLPHRHSNDIAALCHGLVSSLKVKVAPRVVPIESLTDGLLSVSRALLTLARPQEGKGNTRKYNYLRLRPLCWA